MGVTGGFINMAGQIAAVISPPLIGYLVGVSDGSFRSVFTLFIVSLLLSCAIVLSLGKEIGSSEAIGGDFEIE
jgi:MFS family permease